MATMKLVLMEEDHYFIDMCSSYIRTSEHADSFMFTAFTTKEQGFAFIEQTKEAYILLVHEKFMPLPERVFQQHGCLIILSDTAGAADIMEYPVLCKYQPLNQFVSHIVSHFNEYTSSRRLKGNRSTKVISIFSAVGGSGKTITAVHLARELIYRGQRVFYLNLEQLPSLSWLEPGLNQEENHFSRMLYYGKIDPKLQTAKVDLYKRRHQVMGFDYFPGQSEPVEMEEMTEKDTETIICAVLATGAYDVVVLDLDSTLQPRMSASLRMSDQVLWLVVDDRIHWEKTALLMKQLLRNDHYFKGEWTGNIHVLVNKYNGALMNDHTALPLPVTGFTPYIPEWKAYGTIETLQARGAFSESLSSLPFLTSISQSEAHAHVVG
jgi:cellulose biosynthesis protein BcsQ